jgi:hypothetical protein
MNKLVKHLMKYLYPLLRLRPGTRFLEEGFGKEPEQKRFHGWRAKLSTSPSVLPPLSTN